MATVVHDESTRRSRGANLGVAMKELHNILSDLKRDGFCEPWSLEALTAWYEAEPSIAHLASLLIGYRES